MFKAHSFTPWRAIEPPMDGNNNHMPANLGGRVLGYIDCFFKTVDRRVAVLAGHAPKACLGACYELPSVEVIG